MGRSKGRLTVIKAFPRWKASAAINQDLVHSLVRSDSFKEDVRAARKKLGINTLGYKRDFYKAFFIWLDIEERGVDGEPDFHFLRFSKNGFIKNRNPKQKAVGKAALAILKGYNLPANFLYWIISWILFNEAPPWMPLFNYVPIEDLELQTAHKMPLTTQEKRALKQDVRYINKKTKHTSHLPADYKQITRSISEANNPRRKLRNLERDLKIAQEMEKRRPSKRNVLKNTEYINTLRSKGHSDSEIEQMSKKQKQLHGEGFARFEIQGKYTSRSIESKFAREKVKKSRGAFVRKRFERLKKYAKKKL